MEIIPGIDSASAGLAAQRTRLDVIAQNIANAHTTRGPDGRPYARKVVTFEAELAKQTGETAAAGSRAAVRVSKVSTDPRPGAAVYNPTHPHADARGYVVMPNVNSAMEMVDLISASRAYEANLSVVRNGREMVQKTLEIGR